MHHHVHHRDLAHRHQKTGPIGRQHHPQRAQTVDDRPGLQRRQQHPDDQRADEQRQRHEERGETGAEGRRRVGVDHIQTDRCSHRLGDLGALLRSPRRDQRGALSQLGRQLLTTGLETVGAGGEPVRPGRQFVAAVAQLVQTRVEPLRTGVQLVHPVAQPCDVRTQPAVEGFGEEDPQRAVRVAEFVFELGGAVPEPVQPLVGGGIDALSAKEPLRTGQRVARVADGRVRVGLKERDGLVDDGGCLCTVDVERGDALGRGTDRAREVLGGGGDFGGVQVQFANPIQHLEQRAGGGVHRRGELFGAGGQLRRTGTGRVETGRERVHTVGETLRAVVGGPQAVRELAGPVSGLVKSLAGVGQAGQDGADGLFTDAGIDLIEDLPCGVLPDHRGEVVVRVVEREPQLGLLRLTTRR